MGTMANEAIGGFNSFLSTQKAKDDFARLKTVLFDHEYLLHSDSIDIRAVSPLDSRSYVPRGTTALLDAMGRTIDEVGMGLDRLPEELKPRRVLVATLTDGLENSSSRYSRDRIREMIQRQEQVYSWQFLFLGANFDAVATGQDLGIPATHTATAHAGAKGINIAMQSLNASVEAYREGDAQYYSQLASNAAWGGNQTKK
jgi:hypothetical protein